MAPLRLAQGLETVAIDLAEHVLHAPLLDQRHRGTEDAKLLQVGHVDAVVVGIADLRRTRHHDDLLRMEAVEDAEDALP